MELCTDVLDVIAKIAIVDSEIYAMAFTCKKYARYLPSAYYDYIIKQGAYIHITKYFIAWYNYAGELHSYGPPAFEHIENAMSYTTILQHKNGLRCLEYGYDIGYYPDISNFIPPIIGSKIWCKYGLLHRKNGPALINNQLGLEVWFYKGKIHRKKYPAYIDTKNDIKEWYLQGYLHREDGPAISYPMDITPQQLGKRFKHIVLPKLCEQWYFKGILHRIGGAACVSMTGMYWYVNGKLHREDGPAVEEYKGNKKWYINGILHREDGPAVKTYYGTEKWYYRGKLHRTDGPAVIKNGQCTFNVANRKIVIKGKMYQWYLHGIMHCETGPAISIPSKDIYVWVVNGKLHRKDGPAIKIGSEFSAWFEEGILTYPYIVEKKK